MSEPSAADVPSVDGRRARRDRNRETVVDALLELYREGEMAPSVARVAERSGVSHRSVFRYFDDLDELMQVAVERQSEAIAPLVDIPELGIGPLDERIDRFVDARMALYEAAAPVARVARMRAPQQRILAENLHRSRRLMREQLRSHFERELDGRPDGDATFAAAAALCSIEGIELLRHDHELPVGEATAALRLALTKLFAHHSPAT
jgi:AcrR family transcriptional regulator